MAGQTGRPRLFIEDEFPVKEIGIECVRESAPIPGQFPKLKTLHVWWARRPLVASSAAILGSLMPTWSQSLADQFPNNPELATRQNYRKWFLKLCGILGDPIAARKQIDIENALGIRTNTNKYGYKQAFRNSLSPEVLRLLQAVLYVTWGRVPRVLDPTAGGGSIPFQSARFKLHVHANDLNPVAAAILNSTLRIPKQFGNSMDHELKAWGNTLVNRLSNRLSEYFQLPDASDNNSYIFARTIVCPRTAKTVPLVGNWSLRRAKKPVAVRLITRRGGVELNEPEFEVVEGDNIDFDPKKAATWSRGKGVSPWDGLPIDGEYIRGEARAGRMGEVLYAVAIRIGRKRTFRSPAPTDLAALDAAEVELNRVLPEWERKDILPTESVPQGAKTQELLNYGVRRWRDTFSTRQLLVHGCFVEEFHRLIPEVRRSCGRGRGDAILTLLAMMQGKAIDYSSRQTMWDVTRQKVAHAFAIHAFPFKHAFGEFEAGRELFSWCLKQLLDAYSELCKLIEPDGESNSVRLINKSLESVDTTVTCQSAAHLPMLDDRFQTLICIDPPYYDNVQYAELSDYFYVWEKRTLGKIYPEFFADELTNKHDEAVKNKARFASLGKRANRFAHNDYRIKMAAIFRECHRVMRDNGAMCVMFTHKAADAWDGLGTALLQAGFTIETSWPVHTESESSLHQAKSNAAKSTIFLVCRKRLGHVSTSDRTYLSSIEAEIRDATRDALERSVAQGLDGVDSLLSTYGPALSVLSRYWPVYSSETDEQGRSRELRPEEALHIARSEVTRLLRQRLVGTQVEFDALTDFTILAWDVFRARQVVFDEARRLALATGGLDMKELARHKIVTAKSGKVTLLPPEKRVRVERRVDAGRSGPSLSSFGLESDDPSERLAGVHRGRQHFPYLIDAVHTALYVAKEDGFGAAKRWLDDRQLTTNPRFVSCLQALVNAIPRSKTKGKWNIEEAEQLDTLAKTYFDQIKLPEEQTSPEQEQLKLTK